MQDNADKISFSYDVDRNLVLLFDYVTMINNYLVLPQKYSDVLTDLELNLSSEVFKKPLVNTSIALVSEKMTLTDIWKK